MYTFSKCVDGVWRHGLIDSVWRHGVIDRGGSSTVLSCKVALEGQLLNNPQGAGAVQHRVINELNFQSLSYCYTCIPVLLSLAIVTPSSAEREDLGSKARPVLSTLRL